MTGFDMDPIRNPYTPGAGSRPPALTGRDAEIHAFRVGGPGRDREAGKRPGCGLPSGQSHGITDFTVPQFD